MEKTTLTPKTECYIVAMLCLLSLERCLITAEGSLNPDLLLLLLLFIPCFSELLVCLFLCAAAIPLCLVLEGWALD